MSFLDSFFKKKKVESRPGLDSDETIFNVDDVGGYLSPKITMSNPTSREGWHKKFEQEDEYIRNVMK